MSADILEERFSRLVNRVDDGDWDEVRERATRLATTASRRWRKRFVLALAGAALLVLAGTAIAVGTDLLRQQERFHDSPDHAPRLSPLVEIASGTLTSGDEWALIAWKSKVGVCLDFAIPGNSPYACAFPVRGASERDFGAGPPVHAVAASVSTPGLVGGDEKTTIFGVAAREVATVEIELHDGRIVEAPLYDAPPELDVDGLRFFIVRLLIPGAGVGSLEDRVPAYRAYDQDGRLIERVADG